MIIKLIQTPVPDVANCQYFLMKYHLKEANCSMATSRYTTTANTAVRTSEIYRYVFMSRGIRTKDITSEGITTEITKQVF